MDHEGTEPIGDEDLVRGFLEARGSAGREAAFTRIHERHADAVLYRCASLLADDPAAAESAAAEAFTVAYRDLTAGRPPREPHKLRAWLYGIARHRCAEELRRRGRASAGLPEEVESDTYESASRRRLAEVDRILDIVAASFTDPQRRIFHLSTRQHLRGKALAKALGVSEKEANDDTWENKLRLTKGFGAYVLAKDGRPHCPELARLLDEAAWDGENFTKVLRLRILRHMDTCKTCGNCAVCRETKTRLIRPYTPVLLPIAAGMALRDRIDTEIRTANASASLPSDSPPPPPPPAPPAAGRRPATRRLRTLQAGASAVAAVLTVVALLAIRSWSSGGDAPAPRPQDGVAASLTKAMVGKGLVAFDVQARNPSDPAQFYGSGRIDMTADGTVSAATHVLYDPGEDPWFPPDVVVIGDRAYVTPDSTPAETGASAYGPTTVVDRASASKDTNVGNALQTRRLASPANIGQLLRRADRFQEKDTARNRTFTGQAPLRTLAADPAGAFFYQPYLKKSPAAATVSFTITTDRSYLPVSVKFRVPVRHTGYLARFDHDPFEITYRGWAKGKPITRPAADPPAPQWGPSKGP
ncbi:sigma factor [Streptomyces sp. NPDC005336]|uniref:RNA polymerase sigma factor n=1 Tax=Streptomyces sp. NPDC005336 TaxID=3157035 RepID=UPI0033A0BB22